MARQWRTIASMAQCVPTRTGGTVPGNLAGPPLGLTAPVSFHPRFGAIPIYSRVNEVGDRKVKGHNEL